MGKPKKIFGSFLSREQMARVLLAHVTFAHLKEKFQTHQTIKDNLEIQVSVSVSVDIKIQVSVSVEILVSIHL